MNDLGVARTVTGGVRVARPAAADHQTMRRALVVVPRGVGRPAAAKAKRKGGATRRHPLGTPFGALPCYKSGAFIQRSHTQCTPPKQPKQQPWKMLFFPIATVLLGVFVGSLQGKPTEQNDEIKPAAPLEATRNEIKDTPQRTENKEISRSEINEIKEIPRNEFKTAPITESREKTQIREYSERTKERQEEFKGIIEARNKLETAIKPLHGVMESDMASSSLETSMTNSANIARQALEELPVKQVRQMEQIAEEGKSKTVEEQERALREYAEKNGEKGCLTKCSSPKDRADIGFGDVT
ncbi:hypothetical protein niasHT_038297 [Heterodera trifolii]|uniref:Uncharacterized protein n=1 Tax=Heterodera trifolii TaxID=157864 RepID=A0ABD2IZZ1_9BILA